MIDEKESFEKFMETKMKKEAEKKKTGTEEEKKEEPAKKEATEGVGILEPLKKEEEPPKITELIMKEAAQLQEQFFENDTFLKEMNETFSAEMALMDKFSNLADAIMDAACSGVFDCEITQNLMNGFTDMMTGPQGITSFEFQQSGLLKALEIFLTKSPSQAYYELQVQKQQEKDEEMKHSEEIAMSTAQKQASQEISQKDAKCLILRLKVFAHVLCHEKANKLPFKQLINQCHEILSKKEDIIFDETSTDRPGDSIEALRQLNKHVVINLVFDGDMKQIEKSRNEAIAVKKLVSGDSEMVEEEDEEDIELPEPQVAKTKSVALPFAVALSGQKSPEEEKSQVYQKRHKLFTELKQVPLNIQQSDNIWLLEDFLLKRVKTTEDVRKLVQHTRPAYKSNFFNNDKGSEEATQRFEEIDNPEL